MQSYLAVLLYTYIIKKKTFQLNCALHTITVIQESTFANPMFKSNRVSGSIVAIICKNFKDYTEI